MIAFEDRGSSVVLIYSADRLGSTTWVDEKLESEGEVTLSRAFTVRKVDLLSPESDDDFDDDVRRFVIGTVEGDYRTIRKDVLGLKHDLLIAASLVLRRKTFVAERDSQLAPATAATAPPPILRKSRRVRRSRLFIVVSLTR